MRNYTFDNLLEYLKDFNNESERAICAGVSCDNCVLSSIKLGNICACDAILSISNQMKKLEEFK